MSSPNNPNEPPSGTHHGADIGANGGAADGPSQRGLDGAASSAVGAPGGTPRPTLTGRGQPRSGGAGADNSILKALEQNGSAARPAAASAAVHSGFSWGRGALLAALLAALAAGLWVSVHSGDRQPALVAEAQPTPAPVAGPAAAPASAGPPAAASLAVADAPASAPAAVARLETLPEAQAAGPSQAAPASSGAPALSAQAMAAAAAAATAAALAAEPPADKVAAAPATQAAPEPAPVRRAAPAPKPAPTRSAAAPARSNAPPQAAPQAAPQVAIQGTARPAPAADPDVELVTALMTHMSEAERNAARAGAARPDGVRTRSLSAGALPAREQSTIAGLVQSCRSKPAAEAEQCRRDICRGYWGKAEACPVAKRGAGPAAERQAARSPATATAATAVAPAPSPETR